MTPAMSATITAHHHCTMKPDSPMRNFVGQGIAASLPSNTWAKRGNTNVSRKIVTLTASEPMIAG